MAAAKFVYKLKNRDELNLGNRVLAAYLVDQARTVSQQNTPVRNDSPIVLPGR